MSRGIWLYMSARTRRSLTLLWTALFVLSLGLQYMTFAAPQSALAVHDEGLFELDGNVEGERRRRATTGTPVYGGTDRRFETVFVTDPINGERRDKYLFTGR